MRLLTTFLPLATTAALAGPVLSQDMSDGYIMSNASAVITSGADGQPIAAISVTVESETGTHYSTSDGTGFAIFPSLAITPDLDLDADAVPQEVVTLSISDFAHVPIRVERVLAEGTKLMPIALTLKSVGATTAWITAASGGTFSVPGLGTLSVPPGVLTQDAYIHISTVPSYGQSSGQFEDQLVHQVWLGALDQNRNWISAIPQYHVGITLTTRPTIAAFEAGTVYAEYWVSRVVDNYFTEIDSQSMVTPTGKRATIPVADGSNLVTRSWDSGSQASAPETGGGDEPAGDEVLIDTSCITTSSTKIIQLSSRMIVFSSSPMRCGEYDNDAAGEVENGDSFTGSSSLSSSLMSEVGTTVDAVVAEVESSIGTKIEVSNSGSQTTSTVRQGSAGVSQGVSLSGGSCFNATVAVGLVMKKYRIIYVKKKICEGSIDTVSTVLGEFEAASGMAVWWNDMAFDSSCPGCAGTTPTPPNVPGN